MLFYGITESLLPVVNVDVSLQSIHCAPTMRGVDGSGKRASFLPGVPSIASPALLRKSPYVFFILNIAQTIAMESLIGR